MAFALRNLSVLAYTNGFTLWHYRAGDDALHAVGTPGYLDAACDMMTAGDMVMASSAEGATMLCVLRSDDGLVAAPIARCA